MLIGAKRAILLSGPQYDPAAAAFFARIPAQTTARYALLNTVFVGLRAAGLLAKLDALGTEAAADTTTAGQNLIQNKFNLAVFGAPTFTADRGYTGDGSGAYLTRNFTPSTAGGNFTQNSGSVGAYVNGGPTSSAASVLGRVGTGVPNLINPNGGEAALIRINGVSAQVTFTTATARGLTAASLVGATIAGYRGGVKQASAAATTVALDTSPIMLLGNINSSFSTFRLAYDWIGGGLTDTDEANLASIMLTYLTAIGAQ
jgi:hypothetical protein